MITYRQVQMFNDISARPLAVKKRIRKMLIGKYNVSLTFLLWFKGFYNYRMNRDAQRHSGYEGAWW